MLSLLSFLKRFGAVTPEGVRYIPAQWQSALSNGSSAGGIIGLIINGWAAERFGPKQVYLGELPLETIGFKGDLTEMLSLFWAP
jgi:hypothetical protein